MRDLILAIAVIIVLLMFSVPSKGAVTWATVDYPEAIATYIYDISGSNLVGECLVLDLVGWHNFQYDGATWMELRSPPISGIDGEYLIGTIISTTETRGFFYNGTTWVHLDYPESLSTSLQDIEGGNIVGWAGSDGVIYNIGSQAWSTLDYPGATRTYLSGIDGDSIVGGYQDALGEWHDFLYKGAWMTLNLPGEITGISSRNIVTNSGIYNLDNQVFTDLAFPGASQTTISSIDGDNVAGYYVDTSGHSHGFIATIPEPATLLLFGVGGVFLQSRAKSVPSVA